MSSNPAKPEYVVRLVEDRWSTARRAIECAAIVLAGAWAFYTFFYQERIKPRFEAPAYGASIKMERIGSVSGSAVVRAVMRFRNDGTVPTDVYAEALNVYGSNYGRREGTARSSHGPEFEYDGTLRKVRSTIVYANAVLRSAAKSGAAGRHILLRPGQSMEESWILVIPRGFQILEAEGHAIGGRVVRAGTYDIRVTTDAHGAFQFVSPVGGDDFTDFLVL